MRSLFLILFFSVHFTQALAQLDTLLIPNIPNLTSNDLRRKTDMIVRSGDDIWIGLLQKGIIRYQNGNWSRIFAGDSLVDIADDTIQKLHKDPQGNIWIGHRLGLSKFDGTNWSQFPFDSMSGFPGQFIYDFASYTNYLLVAGNKGLYSLDLSNSTWSSYKKSNSGLLCDTIRAIDISPSGEFWVGTDSGVCVISNGVSTNYSSRDMGILSSSIVDVKISSTDTLIIAKGRGIYSFHSGKINSIDSLLHGVPVTDFCSVPMYQLSMENIYQSDPYNYQNNTAPYLLGDTTHYYLYPREFSLNYNFPTSQILYQFNQNLSTKTSTIWQPFDYFKNGVVPCIYNDTLYMASLDFSINYSIIKHPLHPSHFKPFDLPDTEFIGTNNSKEVIRESHVATHRNAFLHANKIRAQLSNRGDLHWDPFTQRPGYEVNPGSLKISNYCAALWLGGYDQNGQLYTAAQTYRQSGADDFWPGPLNINGSADSASFSQFDSIWIARRSDVDEFRYQYGIGNVSNGTFPVSNFILKWPAISNDPLIPQTLAPFVDFNSDGVYNPYDGDYPDVKGDQMAWWIFNDKFNTKTETNSLPMGVEINASAYAINCYANLPILDYTTFYHYEIYNRSTTNYDSCFVGMWSDFDLGDAYDDYIGSHVPTNSIFAYNGDNFDYGYGGFGACPPIQNTVLLQGPEAYSNDGLDNNHDGIIDETNETLGLSTAVFFEGGPGIPLDPPQLMEDYYNFMNAILRNGSPLWYGGSGYGNGSGATTLPCKYMFPGTSDYNFTTPWTMATAGIQPTDVRGVGSSGPFLLPAGSKVTFDVAYVTGPNDSSQNRLVLEEINQLFRSGQLTTWRGAIPPISGAQTINSSTLSATYTISLPNDTSFHYLWTVSNGIILNGQGSNAVQVFWGTLGTGEVSLEVLENGNPCKGSNKISVQINSPMNSDTVKECSIRIYPNPVRSVLNLETAGEVIDNVRIYSLEGKLIEQESWTGEINTQFLSPGVYIVELQSTCSRKFLRKVFIKQRN
jgi:hypothetical protein